MKIDINKELKMKAEEIESEYQNEHTNLLLHLLHPLLCQKKKNVFFKEWIYNITRK